MEFDAEGKKGFWALGKINLLVALGCFVCPLTTIVVALFPVVHLAWSVPMIRHAKRSHSAEYVKGMQVAAGLTTLAGCLCWAGIFGLIVLVSASSR